MNSKRKYNISISVRCEVTNCYLPINQPDLPAANLWRKNHRNLVELDCDGKTNKPKFSKKKRERIGHEN
jgi:hypothetical protein